MTAADTTVSGARIGRRWWSRPDARVVGLSIAIGAATVAVHAQLLSRDVPLFGHELVPIWALALMFAATEGFAIHLRVRRGGHAMSMSDIPMVLALLGTDPTLLVVARVIGGGVGLIVFRHQRGMKFGFNLTLLGAQATAAGLVFHAVAGPPGAAGPREWLAAYLAMFATDLFSAVLVTAAISLHDDPGEWRRLPHSLQGSPLVVVATSIGLVSALAVGYDPRASVLLAVVSLVTYLAYRAYVRQSQGHAQVEELYAFTRALDGSLEPHDVARTVLDQTRDQVRAEVAELIAPLAGQVPDRRYLRMRMFGTDQVVTTELAAIPEDAWWAPALSGTAVLVQAGAKDRSRLAADAPVDGIAVPVALGEDATGVLLVTGSLPDITTFGEAHVRLFQALGNHAGVALAKAQLVDKLRQEVAQKEHLALHDQLTGLPNRQQFQGRLERAVVTEPDSLTGVLMLDLDRFKEINDALGHDTGDALLREVGARLQHHLGDRGVVARLGGDEFGILLPGIGSQDEAVAIGDELTAALDRAMPVGDLNLSTRASLGMAFAPDHGTDAQTLLRRADVAMYVAKDTRSSSRIYQPSDDQNTPRRLALIADLREAIARREITVVFQPKVDPATGMVVGAEALSRWHHPVEGNIRPDIFIPLAEHSGLIRPLTLHVLEVALRRCAAWRRTGHDLHVAVNLSPNSLVDQTLPDVVSRLLGQCGVPASALVLEITESSIMADPARSIATLDRLHALGVKLAIDDFGTGYSSLGRLRELPIHEMKIDKSFVQRISIDHRDRAVVRSAVQLGHALDLAVVAEGVEDEATYQLLTREGCNVVQGYFVSKPLPADEFANWLGAAHRHAGGALTNVLTAY
jgi:diguanylate cyclase (GGDEF)-like protein